MHAISSPRFSALAGLLAGLCVSPAVHGFNSGSTGADGDLNPTSNFEVVLPPSGILNYKSINIPSGVTVTFKPNQLNTPVVLLVQGNVTISGKLSVNGRTAPASGSAGDGVLSDDAEPGAGGSGGYSGGRGGKPIGAANSASSTDRGGGKGLGPGGGSGAAFCSSGYAYNGGAGGSYGTVGGDGEYGCGGTQSAGPTYGSNELLPLVGGSGGGGGGTASAWSAGGGGGGGGALLIAVSGTLTIRGSGAQVTAIGGNGGTASYPGCGVYTVTGGGGGSGGAIRLIATTFSGSSSGAVIYAYAGSAGGSCGIGTNGYGGDGRIRLEADTLQWDGSTSPTPSRATPGPIFIPGLPSLKITSIAGSQVPDSPTGNEDVRLPASTPNPVTVSFATTGIPVGNVVKLSVAPYRGSEVSAVSTALVGSTQAATASATVSLPTGGSTLQASITYTVVAAMGEALSRFAGNERVERITVTAGLDGRSVTRLITVSGREFVAPPEAMRIAAAGI